MDCKRNNCAENRMELRGKVMRTASELFVANGIRCTRMDDIAVSLSISKRTLYELFSDKEDLLFEIVKLHYEQMEEFAQTVGKQTGSVLEKLFIVLQHNMNDMHKVSKGFMQELQRYPRVIEFMREKQSHKAVFIKNFYEAGVREELFLEELNYDIVRAQHEYMQGFMDFVLQRDLDFAEVIETMIFIHLRGIATEKGKRMLDAFYERIK